VIVNTSNKTFNYTIAHQKILLLCKENIISNVEENTLLMECWCLDLRILIVNISHWQKYIIYNCRINVNKNEKSRYVVNDKEIPNVSMILIIKFLTVRFRLLKVEPMNDSSVAF